MAIIIYIYWPEVEYRSGETRAVFVDSVPQSNTFSTINTGAVLVIPKIDLQAEVITGADISVLDEREGIWRHNIDGVDGITVLAGHRRQFLPPHDATFYHLPKLRLGDRLSIIDNDTSSDYRVKETIVLSPEEGVDYIRQLDLDSNQDPEPESDLLVLYTCTPLLTAHKRHIVVAERLKSV